MTDEHVCQYEVEGSGASCYAECPGCRHKLNDGDGVITGSERRIRLAIKTHMEANDE